MIADTGLQVWLETADAQRNTVIPYIEAATDRSIQYRLHAVRQSSGGTSRVNQSGTVRAPARQPTALSRISLGAGKASACRIELILADGGIPLGKYHFDCPQ